MDDKPPGSSKVEVAELPASAANSIYEVDGRQLEAQVQVVLPVEPQVCKSPFRSWLDLRKSGISQDTARKGPGHLGGWV